MPRLSLKSGAYILLGTVLLRAVAASAADPKPEEIEFFERKIRPLLAEHCYKCHSASAEKVKGSLLLDTREGLLKGGESGKPAIVPRDAERSLLIEAIRYRNEELQMPPPKEGRLRDEQVGDLVAWVNMGAPDPRIGKSEIRNPRLETLRHWAFQAPKDHPLPGVMNAGWPRTAIDRFILAKLEEKGLQPSPLADKRTLIRRATYDLTGLPPTPEEVEAFLKDESPLAFACVVDRLLSSPRYGERWGRYWLDVARYADTKGYVYSDREEGRFVHSYAYRDWVIRALNEDMPYDRFLRLQIAADQIVQGDDRRDLAAMGFLTLGRRFLGVVHDIIDDRLDAVMRGTQGLTISCARCHDHKFDPIPTKDYYSLYGVFAGCSERTVPLKNRQEPTDAYLVFEKGLHEREEKLQQAFQKRCDELSDRLRGKTVEYLVEVPDVGKLPSEEFYVIRGPDDLNPTIVRQWDAYLLQARKSFHPVFALWHELARLPQNDFAAQADEIIRSFTTRTNSTSDSSDRQTPLSPHGGERAGKGVLATTSPADGQNNKGAARPINPVVFQVFATNAPNSMKEVAQRYGELLVNAHNAWRAALKEAEEKKMPAPATLPDPAQEQLRQVLYGPGSPVLVPKGAIVDLEWFFDEGGRVELAKLQSEIDRWIIKASGAPAYAVVLEDRPTLRNPRVFLRGNPANKGEEIPRQFLEILAGQSRKPFTQGSGRLELANAIASEDNPLTARVMVNRVWLHHFGAGLVKTPSDFGTRSEAPSHPELLDWLARYFVAQGWSMKKLHRLLMLSAVYQQSSEVAQASGLRESKLPASTATRQDASQPEDEMPTPETKSEKTLALTPALSPRRGGDIGSPKGFSSSSAGGGLTSAAAVDPENRLLWHFNRQRLDFEAMRDSLLAVTGGLDLDAGGKPNELFKRPFATRRTVYGYIDRQFLPGVFRVFDFANPDMHSPQRPDTTVPQQALFFMNGPFVAERARALVGRSDGSKNAESRIDRLYRAVYQRPPTAKQSALGRQFVRQSEAMPPPEQPKPVVSPWGYGYGEFDAQSQRVKTFERLPHFTGEAWQGGKDWPDAKLGWAQVTAEGGHAGNDLQHAAIRRWVSPVEGKVSIKGELKHEHKEGDGIVGRIVLSHSGVVGTWELHNSKADTKVESLDVRKGDTIDFVVDYRANLNSDDFKWVPVIKLAEAGAGARPADYGKEWHAKKDFGGPPEPPPAPLNAWEKYAQVLLLSNEFMFVD